MKIYDEAADGGERAYRIYPQVFEPNFHEMEHMLPLEAGREAFLEIRDLVRRRFPDCILPVEIRFTAADDAMLSPNYRTPTTVFPCPAGPGPTTGRSCARLTRCSSVTADGRTGASCTS